MIRFSHRETINFIKSFILPITMNLETIREARERINPYIRETPLYHSSCYSQALGAEVFLKLELLQEIGSFKIRGAVNAILQLSEKEKVRGVLTSSAGNHGQALACAARMVGVSSTVVVPQNTPETKMKAMKRFGAEVIVFGRDYGETEQKGRQLERKTGRVFISPYNHPHIIAGQGTIALELLEAEPGLDTLLVPVGGGGLIAGIALAAKALKPGITIIGVQDEACPVFVESLKAGKIVDVPYRHSIAEGIHGLVEKETITFPFIQKYVDEMLLVSEDDIKEAIRTLTKRHCLVVEGAGAATSAALQKYKTMFRGRRLAVLVSGGNIDSKSLKEIL